MTPLADRLASPDPPWVELLVLPDGRSLALPAPPPGFVVRHFEGRKCRTKPALLTELARVLEFPSYVGKNWDALEESLGNLEWLPAAGYVLVITETDRLLARHAADYATFVSILETIGREWARPSAPSSRTPTPFHALLTVSARHRGRRRDWRVPVSRADP